MRISRRRFAYSLAGVAVAVAAAAATDARIVERRFYAHGSVLPPTEVLHRHGIYTASVKRQQDGTAYWIPFDSTEARIKAWDRFNADEEWRALRDTGSVALREIQIYPAGKIFEMSL